MSDLYDVKISVRSSVKLLPEIKGLLSMKPNREKLFRDTVFGPWLDIQSHENDSHMMHYVFQHQVSVSNLRPDCPPIIFHIGDHWLEFGRKEFCLITGFRFAHFSEKHGAMSTFFDRYFSENKTRKGFKKINGFDLLNVLKDKQTLVNMLDEDVVRLCLLIASELVFMGKEKRNFLTKHIMWLVDDFDAWNAFPWGEYMWEKFYNRTVNVVSRHTEHHLAQLKKNPNFNATYNLYGFAWAFKIWILESYPNSKKWWSKKANVIPRGLAWSKVTMFEKSDYEELFGPMSNPNVSLILSPEEMSQAWFKDSVEFIKGLDDQDDTFLQDDQGREKCMEQHNGMCGDTEDGTFVDRVVGKNCPKMNRMSVDDGDGVLDSQSDDGDGVLDSQTKDVIEEAAMLPTMSSNSLQAGNAAVSEFFAEFDALKKEVFDCNPKNSDGGVSIEEKPKFSSHHNDSSNHIGGVSSEAKTSSSSAHPWKIRRCVSLDDNMEIVWSKCKGTFYSNSQHHLHLLIKALGTKIENPSIDSVVVVPPKVDDPMLHTIKPKDDFDEADVDSYDDDYMSLFNDEEQPAKSSLNDLELQQEPDIVDVKDGILEQQANADKGKTTVIQETVGVTVEEQPSLGRGLGTLKFKKKNCERALRPNYVLRSAKIRKKKMAMSLKSPFGQQSDTTPVPTKRKTRLNKTEDIVLPFDLEDISGQPRIRSMNHIMTHDPFVENLSRPDGCKSDKVTVPEYMSAFINNKDLPEYRFPWGKRDIVIGRSFWLMLSCLNIGKSGWLTDQLKALVETNEEDIARETNYLSTHAWYNQALPSYMLSLDHNITYSPLVTVVNDSNLLPVGACHGIWYFSYGIHSICCSLWNPSTKRSINILVPAFNSQPKSDKILLGFGICSDTLDPTIIKVSYPRGGYGSWYVSVFTLSSMDWKKLDNDSLPSTDETDCYLFCGWSVLVDVTSLTLFTLLFAIPTPNYVKLLGFTMDEISLPIVEVPGPHQLANSVQVFNISTQILQNLGIQGVAGSFFIKQYKEYLILLPYPDCELYHMLRLLEL
ncbi:phospholipase-like protein [Tanacetum coccineum]